VPELIVIENLLHQVEVPNNGTLSRTIYHDHDTKVALSSSSGGQEVSNKTAAPTILEILKGDARVTFDGEVKELSTASWVFMDANLPYTIYTRSPVIMLVTTLPGRKHK
jgi:glyoxylate utilization-related uncharacterized protein